MFPPPVRSIVPSVLALAALLPGRARAQCDAHWLPGAGIPGADTYVADAIEWDPDGAGPEPELLVIAGNFQVIGNQTVRGLAGWDGQTWREIGVNAEGDIYSISALAVYEGDLIVAGSFSTMGGIPANNIARFDGASWHALGDGPQNGLTGSIGYAFALTLKVVGDRVIVGGFFDSAGGTPAVNVAAWNGSTFDALGDGLAAGVFYEGVFNITEHRGEILAAGDFTQSGAVSLAGVARFDGTSWTGFTPIPDFFPFAVTVHRGQILVGGVHVDFTDPEAFPDCWVVAWDEAVGDWTQIGGTLGSPGLFGITRFVEFQGEVYAGGDFSEDLFDLNASGLLSRFDGTDWRTVGVGGFTGFQPAVSALLEHDGELVVGGSFSRGGDIGAFNLAAWNGTGWRAFAEGTSGRVTRFVEHGGDLVASGLFDSIEGTTAHRLARWDGASWSAIGDGTIDFPVALGSFQGDLVVTAFDLPGRLRHWDGEAWSTFGDGIPDGFVAAMTVYRGKLVVGGSFVFRGPDGEEFRNVAEWDGERWRTLGEGVEGKFFGAVQALTVYRNELVVAGAIQAAGGQPAHGIAKWNGESWSSLGEGLTGNLQVLVMSLATYRGELLACGQFELAGGLPARNLASWDGHAWRALGPDGATTLFGPGQALAEWQGDLYVGGLFWFAGGVEVHNVARWDGSTWSALGGGLDPAGFGAVDALIGFRDHLFAGGTFLHAEDEVSAFLARWGCE
jgi:hypothetical protein